MTKTTLESLLRDRLSDSRAMIGSLDINHDRVLLHFGAIGELARITLSINDNEISIATPDDLAKEWAQNDHAKRSRTPLDPDQEWQAVYEDGKLYAAKGGPVIVQPENYLADLKQAAMFDREAEEAKTGELAAGETITAAFDGEKLTAGDGGPEIILPEAFYQYVAEAILTPDDEDADPAAADGATAAEPAPAVETPAGDDQGANGANSAPAPEAHADKVATQPVAPLGEAPTPPAKWLDFESHKLADLKAIASTEGVELAPEDNTRREIAAKINAKRGATEPAAK